MQVRPAAVGVLARLCEHGRERVVLPVEHGDVFAREAVFPVDLGLRLLDGDPAEDAVPVLIQQLQDPFVLPVLRDVLPACHLLIAELCQVDRIARSMISSTDVFTEIRKIALQHLFLLLIARQDRRKTLFAAVILRQVVLDI